MEGRGIASCHRMQLPLPKAGTEKRKKNKKIRREPRKTIMSHSIHNFAYFFYF